MRYFRAVCLGAVLGTALLGYAMLDIEISLARIQIVMLESSCRSQKETMNILRKQLNELQSWRIQVSLASRMGWGQAHRFIREHPLMFDEEVR
jgi:hypothetical protein